MKTILTLSILFINSLIYAQVAEDSIKKTISLDEAIVSANKSSEMKRQVAAQIQVINAKQIQFSNVQTTGDIISNTGQILVQKSQQGRRKSNYSRF